MMRVWFALILCLLPMAGATQPYPEPTTRYVNDLAQLMSAQDTDDVRAMLTSLRSDTGIHMTVVTLESQAPYAPNQSLETFATNLFNDWGIGDEARNDGILVLVLSDDRAMRIELGGGFAKEWDNVAARVIERSFLPSFRADNYTGGIKDGVADTIAALARPFAKGQPAPKASKPSWFDGKAIFIFAFCAIFILPYIRKIGDLGTPLRRCPSCQRRGALRVSRDVSQPSSTTAAGSGVKTTRCNRCDHSYSAPYTIRRISRSSGGGGFGGGSSGGGGASGRW